MRKNILVLFVAGLCLFCPWLALFANDMAWEQISRENLSLNTVLVNPDNPKIILAGSDNGVILSLDAGESWRVILLLKGQNKKVNFLTFSPADKNAVYAATAEGLFYTSDQGKAWKRIFRGRSSLENAATALAVLPPRIYLGTQAGLFISKDRGRSWRKERGRFGNSHILAIACHPKEPDYVYVACVDGVFKTKDRGESWERIFVAYPREDNGDNNNEEKPEDEDENSKISDINYIALDSVNLNQLYLATSKGVYMSRDKGLNWEALSDYGLLNREVKSLFIPRSNLYAVTEAGIFEYTIQRWQELSVGLEAQKINFLAQDSQGNIYVAGDKGLFRANMAGNRHQAKVNTISSYCKGEPEIKEVQQAAIKYAEVSPEKIAEWRKKAAKKALLPQVGVGLSRNTTDLWHWEGGSTTKLDDDVLRRGRDSLDWDLTLSWDLGELIWNDDQTSIDVRSKLMVELRDDILDEVTKLYFERIRVKMELDNLTIEDRKKVFEKELKLRELTASLDSLTGGYFSRNISKAQL